MSAKGRPERELHPLLGATKLASVGASLVDIAVAAAAIALGGVWLWAFLSTDSVWLFASLIAVAILALAFFQRFDVAGRYGRALATRPRLATLFAVLATVGVAAGLHDDAYPLLMLCTVLLFVVACIGLTIQTGYCGIVNFAGAAFFGTGAYTAAVLVAHGVPHLIAIIAGGVVAGVVGSLLILPVLRTRGYYAALVTIAFGILFSTFLEVNNALGGPQGLKLPGIDLFGWKFNHDVQLAGAGASFYVNYFVLSLALALAAFVFARRVERSWLGLAFDAVRLDETAAAAFGIGVARAKIIAFTLGNLLCGIAGATYAMMQGFIAPNNFTFGESLILVSIVILGGIGNPVGIVPAALVIIVVPQKLQFIQEYRFLLYGCVVILILLFRPEGLLPRPLRNYFPESSA
ncbi:MAG TPA: branched-chain amino acid ABC transporter permease [Casimicrobiaceae bacterium]|nr:branched-chain amino acid ABC transporter permease [Casimicrobiaceae bacterium]